MKIPFIIHADGIEEAGSSYDAREGELNLNLRDFVGENARVVKISVSDYILSFDDVLNSKTIPLLHVDCSSGDDAIFSLGKNPDASRERSLTLICGEDRNSRACMYKLSMMLDCSSLCQMVKATVILKTTIPDYLQNNPSYPNFPPVNSIFINTDPLLGSNNFIEVISGTPLEAMFDEAFTKAGGQSEGSATLRITLDVPPTPAPYISYSQNARGVLTNSYASVKYQNGFGGLKYDLVLDGAIAPDRATPIILRQSNGIILRTKRYVVTFVGEVNGIRSGLNCLDGLTSQLSNPIYRTCYITPLPTGKATLSGLLDIEVIG